MIMWQFGAKGYHLYKDVADLVLESGEWNQISRLVDRISHFIKGLIGEKELVIVLVPF